MCAHSKPQTNINFSSFFLLPRRQLGDDQTAVVVIGNWQVHTVRDNRAVPGLVLLTGCWTTFFLIAGKALWFGPEVRSASSLCSSKSRNLLQRSLLFRNLPLGHQQSTSDDDTRGGRSGRFTPNKEHCLDPGYDHDPGTFSFFFQQQRLTATLAG